MSDPVVPPAAPASTTEDRTAAILTYITIVGFIIAIVGCHFGLRTQGGTEGVGLSTTRTVVIMSITILIADFFLTKLFITITGGA